MAHADAPPPELPKDTSGIPLDWCARILLAVVHLFRYLKNTVNIVIAYDETTERERML